MITFYDFIKDKSQKKCEYYLFIGFIKFYCNYIFFKC